MIQLDRIGNLTEEIVLQSTTEEEEKSVRPSMLYSVLPVLVSNRLPTINSLRQSFADARTRSLPQKSPSVTEIPQPETPPPGYSSQPGSGAVTPHSLSAALGEAEFDFTDEASERPASSRSMPPPAFDVHETSTGIRWKYASLGTSLLAQASQESCAPTLSADETSTVLTRQLYMHGISYLLRGLPAELTPEETLSLQTALPQGLVETEANRDAYALLPVSRRNMNADLRRLPPEDATILHRVTATLILQAFILMQFLLPYIKLFLSQAYQFERTHQITKRLVNTGVTTVDDLGRKSLKLSQTVCQMNDGKVGQAINDMTIWWVRGVTGGVQQGLEEGLKVVRSEHARRSETVEVMG